ncbi:MAG: methionyl-tRNA formyltransferase [Lachnospiraceae bacterium]|nr:methionyl-tRNA formyltransferase [Candidatus Colinaster equi]
MRVIFMGTPDFATGALQAIIDAGHDVVLVVTQPDRQKGRGKEVQFPPVKECAIKNGIDVFQPDKIKSTESVEYLKKYEADIFVVAAFGQILSSEILNMPKYGCVNIHASLLPKYRGAAPIQWSILDGEEQTGVTIMQMNEGLDTGDMLLQKAITIEDDDTGESLFDKLAVLGAEAIVEALPLIEKGQLTPVAQDEELSTYAKMLKKDLGNIDWNMDAVKISRYVRGLNSWPSAYSFYNGKTLKIWKATAIETTYKKGEYNPGDIVNVDKDSFEVMCGEGCLQITEVQLEGKKRMTASDFLRGCNIKVGDRLLSGR